MLPTFKLFMILFDDGSCWSFLLVVAPPCGGICWTFPHCAFVVLSFCLFVFWLVIFVWVLVWAPCGGISPDIGRRRVRAGPGLGSRLLMPVAAPPHSPILPLLPLSFTYLLGIEVSTPKILGLRKGPNTDFCCWPILPWPTFLKCSPVFGFSLAMQKKNCAGCTVKLF